MSDLDEIPNPDSFNSVIKHLSTNDELVHFEQKWFMYYFNNYCNNKWYGTHICKFSFLLKYSVDLLQYDKEDISKLSGGLVVKDSGWHFSFLGGHKKVKEKLQAYDYQGGRTSFFLSLIDKFFPNRLQKKILNNKDIFLTNRVFYNDDLSNLFSANLASILSKFPNHIK
jgi:beta-1,4-mannosyl-glycoprotein beta-1,4-N-acetylglucosaminyltransferase